MKNIFGLKVDKSNTRNLIDGERFITNQVDLIQEREMTDSLESINVQKSKSKLPIYINIIEYVLFIIGGMCVVGLIKSLADVSLAQAYKNAAFIFFLGGFSLIIAFTIYIINKIKTKKVVTSEEFKEVIENIEKSVSNSREILGVPNDAKPIDVLTFKYKESKNGKIKITTSHFYKYENSELYVYVKNDCLCFADSFVEISIPLTSLVEIRKINKNAMVSNWNKTENYNSGPYKKYKIKSNDFGAIYIKPYYAIIIEDAFGEYEIYVPSYDIEEVIKLTDLKIVDNEK